MKAHLRSLLHSALQATAPDHPLAEDEIHLEATRDPSHGDFASNLAMGLAKPLRKAPRQIAEALLAALPESRWLEKAEIAGPGFINLFLKPEAFQAVVPEILQAGEHYGLAPAGSRERVMVEFVSANPTGPLHVGHGRNAAYGDAMASLLAAAGHTVYREYYVNDAGRQTDILGVSLWLRYLELCGEKLPFPENGYPSDYVIDAAGALHAEFGARLHRPAADVRQGLPPDANEGGDKEQHLSLIHI